MEYMSIWGRNKKEMMLVETRVRNYMGKVDNFEYGNFDIEKFNFENSKFEFKFNFELDLGGGDCWWC